MALTIKVIQQDNFATGGLSVPPDRLAVTVSCGGNTISLDREEALYLVADLGKRLMQLSTDPDLAIAGKAVEDAMEQAIREVQIAPST